MAPGMDIRPHAVNQGGQCWLPTGPQMFPNMRRTLPDSPNSPISSPEAPSNRSTSRVGTAPGSPRPGYTSSVTKTKSKPALLQMTLRLGSKDVERGWGTWHPALAKQEEAASSRLGKSMPSGVPAVASYRSGLRSLWDHQWFLHFLPGKSFGSVWGEIKDVREGQGSDTAAADITKKPKNHEGETHCCFGE